MVVGQVMYPLKSFRRFTEGGRKLQRPQATDVVSGKVDVEIVHLLFMRPNISAISHFHIFLKNILNFTLLYVEC